MLSQKSVVCCHRLVQKYVTSDLFDSKHKDFVGRVQIATFQRPVAGAVLKDAASCRGTRLLCSVAAIIDVISKTCFEIRS